MDMFNNLSSEKLQKIEAQLQSKLEEVKQDMTSHIHSLEKQLLTSMQQQIDAGDSMKSLNEKIERLTDAVALLLSTNTTPPTNTQKGERLSTSKKIDDPVTTLVSVAQNTDGDESLKTSSTGSSLEVISSPQHKNSDPSLQAATIVKTWILVPQTNTNKNVQTPHMMTEIFSKYTIMETTIEMTITSLNRANLSLMMLRKHKSFTLINPPTDQLKTTWQTSPLTWKHDTIQRLQAVGMPHEFVN